MPKTKHDNTSSSSGIPGLLSQKGYQVAWNDYQKFMIDRLNFITEGYNEANVTPKALTLTHARNPEYAALFNYASMSYNNHFFFEGIAASEAEKGLSETSPLHQSLLNTFGSMSDLKQTMIEMAYTMFGPGFVWLVWSRNLDAAPSSDGWRLLPTYLAGTPFPEAGFRQQGVDQNTAGSFGAHSKAGREGATRAPGTGKVEPVLCVNTWEHVYLQDYGVAGKREYLEKWWDAIDWREVGTRAPSDSKESRSKMQNYRAYL